MNVVVVRTRPSFDDVESIAMRIGVLVEPDFFVFEPDGIDY
jgi:hypothetical protein